MMKTGRVIAYLATFVTGSGWLSAATVKYKDLAATRLPYGEAITISGDLKDFVADDPKLGSVMIADWVNVKKISLSVTVEGLSARSPVDATIAGATWTVAIDQFPKNTPVKFDFKVTGDLKPDKAGQVVDHLLNDDKFNQATDGFFAGATKESLSNTATLKTAFITTIAPMVKGQLPGFLAPTDTKPIVDALTTAAGGWADAKSDMNALITVITGAGVTSLAGVTATATPTEAFAKLKRISTAGQVKAGVTGVTLSDNQANAFLQQILAFLEDYQSAVATLNGLATDLTVSLQLTDVSTVQDFAKYGAVDVGVLYSPPASSLRSFVTVNVYLGAVEDSPAPATPCRAGVSPESLRSRIRQIADAQARVGEATNMEKRAIAELSVRQAALDNASARQIAKATQDRDSARQFATASTAARQQVEKIAAEIVSPSSGAAGRACTFKDSIFWQTFRQRFSISGGVSTGDLSGQKNSPFASNYAFVIGGGWRLNKYFRALAGDLLYRNQDTDRMNHVFCFGFSVDVSALGNITSVFGKAK